MEIIKVDSLSTPEILEKSGNLLLNNVPEIFFPNPRIARYVLAKNPVKNNIMEHFLSMLSKKDCFSLSVGNNTLLLGLLTPMKFESLIFGKKMYSLSIHETNLKPIPLEKKLEFLGEILLFAKNNGIKHVSCKIPSGKISTAQALELSGFYLTSSLVTYLFVRGITKTKEWRSKYPVREARPEEKRKVLELAWKSFKGTRFYNDPELNNEQCDELYLQWTRNCFDKGWASAIFVAENSKKDIVGFFTYLIDPIIKEFFGIIKGGSGISACSPEAKGAYLSLLDSSIKDVPKVNGFLGEFTTQSENIEVVRVFQKFGLEFGKSELVFHKGLT